MLNLPDPQRVRPGSGWADYHLVGGDDDPSQLEKGDSLSLTAVESDEDVPIIASDDPPKTRKGTRRLLKKLAVLLPSFLRRRSSQEPRKAHPTAWLDGLRGIAAFFVVWHHMSLLFFSWDIHNGWEGRGDNPVRLPIVRLAISGLPNVYVFFVVSGYALSYRPLKLLRDGRTGDAHGALASSAFRRHTRLFAPAAAVCFFSMLGAYLGLFGGGEGVRGVATATMPMPRFDSLWDQFRDYARFMLLLCDPFRAGPAWWVYNEPLWTLPVEFRGSFVVFGLLLALAGCGARTRITIVASVAAHCLYFAHFPEFLFCGGMLVAALRLHSGTDEAADDQSIVIDTLGLKPRTVDILRSWWAYLIGCRPLGLTVSFACFAASLFVLSMPEIIRGGGSAAGYWTLARLIPVHYFSTGFPENFFLSQAAIALVFTVDRSPCLQTLFTNRFAQYLGRISFSLYLIHGLLLQSAGWSVGKLMIKLIYAGTDGQYVAAVAANALVFWPMAIWTADLGWRFIDLPSVSFSAWLQRKVCSRHV